MAGRSFRVLIRNAATPAEFPGERITVVESGSRQPVICGYGGGDDPFA